MPNNFLTPSIIANEALMVLKNKLVMANLVHRDYDKEFVNVGDTITIRKPADFISDNFTGETTDQDVIESGIPVKIDRFRDITVPVTSKEMTLDIKNFSEQIIEPAMAAHAAAIDADIIATVVQDAGRNLTVSSDDAVKPTKDIAKAASYLDFENVPSENRGLVLNSQHKLLYVTDDNLSKASYAGDNNALRKNELGELYGFDTYQSQSTPYPYGYLDNAVGTAKSYKITGNKGDKIIAISALNTATATVKKGDCFIIDGYVYHIMEDKVGSGNAIVSVAINQRLHKKFDAEDVMVVSSPVSIGFHRNGIALVSRSLALPMGNKNAYIASADGLAIRVVFDYDSTHKVDRISLDLIYGIKTLNKKMLVSIG